MVNSSFARGDLQGTDLIKLLESVGWTHDRSTGDHAIMTKPGERSISIRVGVKGGVTKEVVKLVTKAIGYRIVGPGANLRGGITIASQPLPLAVRYRGDMYAVVSDEGHQWMLQNLNSGARFRAPKAGCTPMEPEIIDDEEEETPEEETMPTFAAVNNAEAPAPPTPAPIPAPAPVQEMPRVNPTYTPTDTVSPLTSNASDFAALVRLSRRRVEGLKVEYEQASLRLAQIEEQYTASLAWLRSLGIDIEETPLTPEPTPAPKRTVLPPTGPGKRRGGRSPTIPKDFVDKVKMVWLDSNKTATASKILPKLRDLGVRDQPDSLVNGRINYLLKQFRDGVI